MMTAEPQLDPLTDGEKRQAKRLAADWLQINADQGDLFTPHSDVHHQVLDSAGANIFLHRHLADADFDRIGPKNTFHGAGCLVLNRDDEQASKSEPRRPLTLVVGNFKMGYRFAGWLPFEKITRTDDNRFKTEHDGYLCFAEQDELDKSIETLIEHLQAGV